MGKDLLPVSLNRPNPYKLWLVLAGIVCLLSYVFYQIRSITFPFFAGLIGAYIFNKPVNALERMGVNRSVSAGVVITCVLMFLGLLLLEALPFLKNEFLKILQSYPILQERFLTILDPVMDSLGNIAGDKKMLDLKAQFSNSFGNIFQWIIENLASMLTQSLASGLAIANIISLVVLIPLIMFYALSEWPKIISSLDGLLPKVYAPIIRRNAENVDKTLGHYARGQLIVSALLILLYSIAFLIIDLPHALFTGFITGFFSFIPYIGVFIGFILAMTIALSNFVSMFHVIAIMVIFGTFILLDGYFLTPRLIGERIGLRPAFLIFALLALGSWFGFLGIMFALPLAAVISALLKPLISWYKLNFTQ